MAMLRAVAILVPEVAVCRRRGLGRVRRGGSRWIVRGLVMALLAATIETLRDRWVVAEVAGSCRACKHGKSEFHHFRSSVCVFFSFD